jgi:hypothetical protein
MVNEVKINIFVKSPPYEVDSSLPETIVKTHPTLAMLPEPSPPRQIKINPLDVGHWLLGESPFNRRSIIRSCDYPDLMEPGDLFHPVPAYARF